MVKLKPRDIAAHLSRLDPAVPAVLVYGPDEGLVRERILTLAGQVVEDINDPFNCARLSPGSLKEDPSRIADEMQSQSLMGGRRAVMVEGAADALAGSIQDGLAAADSGNLLLVSAGDLGPRAKLRTLFEKHDSALAMPCYLDEGRGLDDLIQSVLQEAGYKPDRAAMDYLRANLGSDRGISRQELEKLALYLGDREDRTIRLEDVEAVIGDSGAMTLSDIAEAATGGDMVRLDQLIRKARENGESPVAALIMLQRRLQRLHRVAGAMLDGKPVNEAMRSLRPPVFFKEKPAFERDCRTWSPDLLGRAIMLASRAELLCKGGEANDETILAQLCLKIASMARRGRPMYF